MQLPTFNSSYKDINFTLVVGNEQGYVIAEVDTFPFLDSGAINWKKDLAIDLNMTEEYFVQPKGTVHSQTVTSPKYHDIFSKLF